MAVAFDAFSDPGARIENTNSQSWTHTPVGTPTGVAIGAGTNIFGKTVTSVTYGGVSCTLGKAVVDGGGVLTAAIWGLANPPSGAQTVVVNLSGNDYGWCWACTVTGGDTSGVFEGGGVSDSGALVGTPTHNVPSAANELCVEFVQAGTTLSSPGSGQTQRLSVNNGAGAFWVDTKPATGNPESMSYSQSTNPSSSAYVAISFQIAGAAPASLPTKPVVSQFAPHRAASY